MKYPFDSQSDKDITDSTVIYYLPTDYLGSIMALSNTSGTVVEKYAYDAFGNRRNPLNWSQPDTRTNLMLDRGYTGHACPPECQWRRKHLDGAHIINMPVRRSPSEGGNGRMPVPISKATSGYDPIVGRMLSPDPVIQNPYSTQPACRNASTGRNYNRYSYVVNNPLKYTDPSGYNYKPVDWDKSGGGVIYNIMGYFKRGGRYDFSGANARADGYFGIVRDDNGRYMFNTKQDIATFSGNGALADAKFYLKTGIKASVGVGEAQPDYGDWTNYNPSGYANEYFGDAQSGGGGISMVEERFIQATGILGFSGPTIGLSIAKFPNGEFGVYWNNGNTTGVDLPNLDIGVTIHTSKNQNIDWETALQGWSSSYGGSVSFFAATVGGNQYTGDFFSTFMKDYGSVSIMLNLGPNDLSGGVNKNTTNQQHLFTLPIWFDIFW